MTAIFKQYIEDFTTAANNLRPGSYGAFSRILASASKDGKVQKVKATFLLLLYSVMKVLRLHQSPTFLADLDASSSIVDAYEFMQENLRETTEEEDIMIMNKMIQIGSFLHSRYKNRPDAAEKILNFHFPKVGSNVQKDFMPLQKILLSRMLDRHLDWKKDGMLHLYDSILVNQFSGINYDKLISSYEKLNDKGKFELQTKCKAEYKKACLLIKSVRKFLKYPEVQILKEQSTNFLSRLESELVYFEFYFNESVKKVAQIGEKMAAPFFGFDKLCQVLPAFCCMINASILRYLDACPEFFDEKNTKFFMNLQIDLKMKNYFESANECWAHYVIIKDFLYDLWNNKYKNIKDLKPRYANLLAALKCLKDNTYFKTLVMLHKDKEVDVIKHVVRQLKKIRK